MNIVNARVDDRLIHGQVATLWINYLKATRIMVIDDEVINEPMSKLAIKTACPAGLKLSILARESAAKNILDNKYQDENLFIIVKSPKTLLFLIEKGVDIKEITLGNMKGKENSFLLKKSVSVDQNDVEVLKKLIALNINLIVQIIPSDERSPVEPLLKEH